MAISTVVGALSRPGDDAAPVQNRRNTFYATDYGVPPSNGITTPVDATSGFQAWADAMAKFSADNRTGAYGVIPADRYRIRGTVTFDPMFRRTALTVDAQGCYVYHDPLIPGSDMFTTRQPTGSTDAADTIGDHDMWRWRGGTYQGNNTTDSAAFGWKAVARMVMQDINIRWFDLGILAEFGLIFRLQNAKITQCRTNGVKLTGGSWPGATPANSAGNASTLENVRFVAVNDQPAQLHVDNCSVVARDCVFEGGNPEANIVFNSNNTSVLGSTFSNLHCENRPTVSNVIVDCIQGNVEVDFQHAIHGPFIDVRRATSILVGRVPWGTADETSTSLGVPAFVNRKDQGRTPRWIFQNSGRQGSFEATNPVNWDLVNGNLPLSIMQTGSFHHSQSQLPNFAWNHGNAGAVQGSTADGSGLLSAVDLLGRLGLIDNQVVDDGDVPQGTTALRPAHESGKIKIYFDTDVGHLVVSDGVDWLDLNGAEASVAHTDTSNTGDGVAAAFGPVNHALNTSTPTVHVFVAGILVSDGWSATITDANNLTVDFGTPPANGAAITIKVEA